MGEKLTKVRAPIRDAFPVPDGTLVQVTSQDKSKDWQTLTVYLDGKEIGKLETSIHTPHRNIPGTRLRKDLKPRRVWYQREYHRIKFDTLGRGVLEVIRDYQKAGK